MAGIDKITQDIIKEAEDIAKEKREAALDEADKIQKIAEEECNRLKKENEQKIELAKKSAADRAKSSAQLKKRQAVLNAKQQIISDILDEAYQQIFSLDEKAYFEMIEKMLKKFTLAKNGEIYFAEKDLKRLPQGFEAVIEKTAKENGGTLVLAKEGKSIDGGFILEYGGVEENCSIQSMFHTMRESLADKVHEVIF